MTIYKDKTKQYTFDVNFEKGKGLSWDTLIKELNKVKTCSPAHTGLISGYNTVHGSVFNG